MIEGLSRNCKRNLTFTLFPFACFMLTLVSNLKYIKSYPWWIKYSLFKLCWQSTEVFCVFWSLKSIRWLFLKEWMTKRTQSVNPEWFSTWWQKEMPLPPSLESLEDQIIGHEDQGLAATKKLFILYINDVIHEWSAWRKSIPWDCRDKGDFLSWGEKLLYLNTLLANSCSSQQR